MRGRRNKAGRSSVRKFRQERLAAMRAEWRVLLLAGGVLHCRLRGLGCGRAGRCAGDRCVRARRDVHDVTSCSPGILASTSVRCVGSGGAFGEQWTAEELEKLGSAWRVYHDIPDGFGNWDHVVVGPGGVFAIDSKNLVEPSSVDDQGLRAGRLRFGGRATRGSAVRMKELIEGKTGLAVWVQGVVCVWGELPGGTEERDRVIYVRGPSLAETLQTRPIKLADEQRQSSGWHGVLDAITKE